MKRQCPVCNKYENVRPSFTLNKYDMVKCERCDFVFVDISKEEVKKANFFVSDYVDKIYRNNQTFIDDIWFVFIASLFKNFPKNSKVLDVGCGNGMLLKNFKKLGFDCFGLDVSPWAKKYAERYGYFLYDKEVENDYLPDDYFDVVLSTSTLEHIYDPYRHIKSILRILKPGGVLFISGIPNFGSLAVKVGISKFYFNLPPSHVNYFTPRSMYNLIKRLKRHYELSFKINTYGIPESFYFYHKIKELYKMLRRRNNNKKGFIEDIEQSKEYVFKDILLKVNNIRGFKKVIGRIIIYLNYILGKPFKLGDKIEVIIYKR